MSSQSATTEKGLHVAVIMDGNGRWATSRGLPRLAGHRAGVAAVRRTVECAPELGIDVLTLYAFSSDNWRRPLPEVEGLFLLIRTFLRLEAVRLKNKGVRLQVIGQRIRLPDSLVREIERAEQITAAGDRLCLRVAIDYSSRGMIVSECTKAAMALAHHGLPSMVHLTEQIEQTLRFQHRDVDLLIRTGGEQRLSDFLLWECAYAELYFAKTKWPDFDEEELASALNHFRLRERRFGGLPDNAYDPVLSSVSLPV